MISGCSVVSSLSSQLSVLFRYSLGKEPKHHGVPRGVLPLSSHPRHQSSGSCFSKVVKRTLRQQSASDCDSTESTQQLAASESSENQFSFRVEEK